MDKELGTMIDQLYQMREQRLAIDKQIAELKSAEAAMKQIIIDTLKADGLEGAKGGVATAAIQYKVKPHVTDWDKVYAFVREQDMFALLYKQITPTLWAALREDGVEVPGIEPMALTDLSLTKSKRS